MSHKCRLQLENGTSLFHTKSVDTTQAPSDMSIATGRKVSLSQEAKRSKGHQAVWTLTGYFERESQPQTISIRKSPFVVGRRPDLDLSLNSNVVSGRHAEFVVQSGRLYVRDASSTNGTYVNGVRIGGSVDLSEGDLIEVCDVHLRVGLKASDSSPYNVDIPYNKTCRFDSKDELSAIRGLNELIETRSLAPCFQPIHCLKSHDVYGYEFLARSSVTGVQNPGQMFDAARKAGREIELSMLCRDVGVELSCSLPSRMPLFLNTHPSEPLLEGVVPQMRRLRMQQPNRPLVLEIHEGAITEPGLVRRLRSALREFDVQLAFDDFGAGQARIRELICAPSDYIKFDAALIRDLQDVSRDQFALFHAILKGIQSEGAITVAEGVEDEAMLAICNELGFDLLQGYILSRPAIMHPARSLDGTASI